MITKKSFIRTAERFHLYNHGRWTLIGPFFYSFGLLLVTYLLYEGYQHYDLWSNMQIAIGNTFHFCEHNRFGQFIVQPSNTWSNIGYFTVGFLFLSLGIKDHYYEKRKQVTHFLARYPGFSILLGISTLYMFVGSFIYHASVTRLFQKIDQTGIYFIITALLAYNIFKLFPTINYRGRQTSSHYLILISAMVMNVLFYTVLWKININALFPALILLFFAINILNIKKYKGSVTYMGYMKAAIITLLAAAFVWILDRNRVVCVPTSVFQGHALWHLLTAASLFFIYFFYRGENIASALSLSLERKEEE